VAESTPLVHRSVRSGGVLLAVAAAQFAIAMALVQQHFPGYSLTRNYISDLGGASSPWALLFDASAIALGAIAIIAFVLIWSAFEPGTTRAAGLGILIVAGIGAVGVGVFPETTHVLDGRAHDVTSAVAFVGAGLGFLVLSFAMRQSDRWRWSRPYTLVSGLVVLVATGLFEAGIDLGLGPGGMERLIVFPVLVWGVVEGIHIALLHRFAPGLEVVVSAAE
jgi:hypothetical membrane protein